MMTLYKTIVLTFCDWWHQSIARPHTLQVGFNRAPSTEYFTVSPMNVCLSLSAVWNEMLHPSCIYCILPYLLVRSNARSVAAHLLRLWVRIPPGHGFLSVVFVVFCQVEVTVTNWSLLQRSPTDCGVSCVAYKSSEWGSPGTLGAVTPKKNAVFQIYLYRIRNKLSYMLCCCVCIETS
jgi:hypothetical protein